MARPEVTVRKIAMLDAADDADAFTVNEFCGRHRISVQLFYKNRKQMPRTFNVGTRVLDLLRPSPLGLLKEELPDPRRRDGTEQARPSPRCHHPLAELHRLSAGKSCLGSH